MTETIKLKLLNNNIVDVVITRKKIKNFYLKILPNNQITVSMPLTMDIQEIYNFLEKQKKWIEKSLSKFKNNENIQDDICSRKIATILGAKYIIFIYKSKQDKVIKDGFSINIYSTKHTDMLYVKQQYDKYFFNSALNYFNATLDKYYPIVQKYNIQKPKLKIKNFKSKWGSCIPKENKITLNLLLYKTLPECIDYVVLHELSHLLFLGHSKKFYSFIEANMPNYKTIEKKLDYEYSI